MSVEVGEKQTAIDLDVVVEYGARIADVARAVRRNVITAVEQITGLEVIEVNIAVNDIHLPGEDEPELRRGWSDRAPARDDPEARAAFREFVRTHHPDVGGDPAEFAEGLARFRAGQSEVDDRRYDAPIRFVVNRRGVAAVLARLRRRRRPPRVQ